MKTPIRFPITSGSHFRVGAPIFLTPVLATLLCWTLATGATGQPEATPVSAAKTAPAAQPAATLNPTCTPPQTTPPPADGDLKFVVALFRHGVRSPLPGFDDTNADKHAASHWPTLPEWGGGQWGNLTPQGTTAVAILGAWYGSNYSKALGKGFRAYLWADLAQRTQKTAATLASGLQGSACVTVEWISGEKVDPLFHPFQAMCGTPCQAELDRIANNIRENSPEWLRLSKGPLGQLDDMVLACQKGCASPTPGPSPCEPLSCVKETVNAWRLPTPTPGASPPSRTSPITWDGQFSYASSATEAFLLEYANGMPPGWGKVQVGQPDPRQPDPRPKLSDLLRLHEFYFDQTEREPEYLAGLQGANLVREILAQLNRAAGRKSQLDGKCPRGEADHQFVGLVGHDTNLANLNALLDITWKFNDSQMPDDIRNLPDNDALPAGALVFELRQGSPEDRVRIQYITQSLDQIKDAPKPSTPYLVPTTCGPESRPCEMSLGTFNKIAGAVIKRYGLFLSNCQKNGNQTCP